MTTEEVRGLRSPPPVPIKRPLILIRTPRKETVSFTTKGRELLLQNVIEVPKGSKGTNRCSGGDTLEGGSNSSGGYANS